MRKSIPRSPLSGRGGLLALALAAAFPSSGPAWDRTGKAFGGKAVSVHPAPSASQAARASAPVSDADLKAMARKLARGRKQGALGKTGAAPALTAGRVSAPSALRNTLLARQIRLGPNAPLALPGAALPRGPRGGWSASGTPSFLDGDALPAWAKTSGPFNARAGSGPLAAPYFQENRAFFKLRDPSAELRFARTSIDRSGCRHETYQQQIQGIPVWGRQINAHFDPRGALYAVTADYVPTPALPAEAVYKVDAGRAIAIATGDLARRQAIDSLSPEARRILEYAGPTAEKNVWLGSAGRPHLAWRVEVRPDFRDHWRYFIDGESGEVLEKYDATNDDGPKTGSGTDLFGSTRSLNTYQVGTNYYLIDATRKSFNPKSALPNDPKGALWTLDAGGTDLTKVSQVSSRNNAWTDAAAVSAHYNLGRVFEYFLENYNRLGIDGAGSTMISAVHVTEKGKRMDNAYWNGKAMAYGDGDKSFLSLARALDVAAHEMTHGVIAATVNLEYKFQSGALNESLADVFGAMVDAEDWKMGEDAVNPAVFRSGALRDMQDPHNGASGPSEFGWQPAHMSEFVNAGLENDNGAVHVNSGIPNRACFLIADKIGRDKTAKIYYRVLEARYLNPGSQFIDMRLAAIRSATDLFGEASAEVAAVKDGFAGVGIGSGSEPDKPTPRPQDTPPVEGQEFVALVNADPNDNSLYVAKPVVAGDDDLVQLTETQVFSGTGNPMAIPDDGSAVAFIDAAHALRGIDDSGEQVVNADPIWKSIAVSPDGTKLAATTLEPDAKIYILDLADPDASKAIPLYTPTTGVAIKAENVVAADALDFNSTGEYLLYDALNRVTQAEGDPIEYYDANLLSIKEGVITPFLPARPEGISIGNPSFAQTSDLAIVFDLYDGNTGAWSVVTADLFTGAYALIDSNGTAPGFPRFSTRDDMLVYERAEGDVRNVVQAPLAKDKISLAGPSAAYLSNAQKPLWFSIGKRPAGIRLPGKAKPAAFGLRADAGGSVRLELPVAAEVVLTAYDLSGRRLGQISRGRREAGSHRVAWNRAPGAGMYLIRMEARPGSGAGVTRTVRVLRGG